MSANGYVLNTCQQAGGQSGSPIFARARSGRFYAIGLIAGNHGYGLARGLDWKRGNVSVNFESDLKAGLEKPSEGDLIQAALRADPCL